MFRWVTGKESNADAIEVQHQVDELFGASRDAVKFPDHQNIELALLGVIYQAFEYGPMLHGAFLLNVGDRLPNPVLADPEGQLIDLICNPPQWFPSWPIVFVKLSSSEPVPNATLRRART